MARGGPRRQAAQRANKERQNKLENLGFNGGKAPRRKLVPVNRPAPYKLPPPTASPQAIKTAYLKVVNNIIQQNKSENLYYFVYEYLRFVPATVFRRRWTGTLEQRGVLINRSIVTNDVNRIITLFSDKQYSRILTSISPPPYNINYNINFTDKTLSRYFFLAWLDTIHDETSKRDFHDFMNLIHVPKVQQDAIKAYIGDGTRDPLINDLITDSRITRTPEGSFTSAKGKFEDVLKKKESLSKYFDSTSQQPIEIQSGTNISRSLRSKGYDTMSVLLDMEVNQDISTFVNVNNDIIASKITVANIMDPGVYMLSGIGFNDEISTFSRNLPTNLSNNLPNDFGYDLNNQYILNEYDITFTHNGGAVFMRVYSEFNSTLNPVDFNTSRAIQMKMDIGGNTLNITPTRKTKNGTYLDVLNKLYGDTFQGIIVAVTNKVRQVLKSAQWFLGTGDGNFTAIYANLCDAIGVNAKLIVDLGLKEKIIDIYGLDIDAKTIRRRPKPVMSVSGNQPMNGGNARNQEINNKLNILTDGRGKTNVEIVNELKRRLKNNAELMAGFRALKSPISSEQNKNNIGRRESFISALKLENWTDVNRILREAKNANSVRMGVNVNVHGTESGVGAPGRNLPLPSIKEENGVTSGETKTRRPIISMIGRRLGRAVRQIGGAMRTLRRPTHVATVPQNNPITYKNFTNMGMRLGRSDSEKELIKRAMRAVRIINENPEMKRRFRILKSSGTSDQKREFLNETIYLSSTKTLKQNLKTAFNLTK